MKLRLATDAEPAARRLVELGADGVGGVTGSGRDDDGLFVTRLPAEPTLAAWLSDHGGALDWRVAVALAASLAEAAAACERRSLFPGAIEPGTLAVRDSALELRADALVLAIAGATSADVASSSGGSARWLAPAQAAGAPPDNAGNRYAIGLIVYRLIAGEHPFAARGLRLGLDDQAQRGAPPLPDAVAASLPPGLQSLTLRLLDPDPAARPATAAEIARLLRAFLADRADPRKYVAPEVPRTREAARAPVVAPVARVARSSRAALRRAAAVGVIAIGVAVAAWAIASVRKAGAGARVEPRAAMRAAGTMADCAGCHPRQAAEWSRSVMAHAVNSPLYQSLEMLVEEQIGRDRRCPDGAGILRAAGAGACTDARTGIAVTGSGGESWCVNCHAPSQNLTAPLPAWEGADRRPLRDVLGETAQEGVGCTGCHSMTGPARPGDRYQGNPTWISAATGIRYSQRPEDQRGLFGIANSGYALDALSLVGEGGERVAGGAHRRPDAAARAYLRSSEMCGACHDVRLFGTDAVTGESFKRLRNGYSEWVEWSGREVAAGRTPATCQDCHMSQYPGVCVPGDGADPLCPAGTVFSARPPGSQGLHYFSGVDVPLAPAFDPAAIDDATLDVAGIPLGAAQRRDLLLARAVTLALESPTRSGDRLEIPIVVENTGAGHRVPAGFSQERELWIEVKVTDARGIVVYEAGRVAADDDDLHDKLFLRVTTDPDVSDRAGRPIGLFGADVADGPDLPQWTPDGAPNSFRGRGLINFQNGFLRCVRCIGTIDAAGACQAAPGQGVARADRYDDASYDPDTGACISNLRGDARFLETYFPVGALDARRGIPKAPDAIIDTRSLAPGEPVRYVYELDAARATGPLTVEVRLRFRAFPPYLLRAFVDYEAAQAQRGRRPSGALIDRSVLDRLEIVDVASARAVVP